MIVEYCEHFQNPILLEKKNHKERNPGYFLQSSHFQKNTTELINRNLS